MPAFAGWPRSTTGSMRGFLARVARSSTAGAIAAPEAAAGPEAAAAAATVTTGAAAPSGSWSSAIAGGSPATVIPAAAPKLAKLMAVANQNDAAPSRGEAGVTAFLTREKPLFAANRPESSGDPLSMLADIHKTPSQAVPEGSGAAVETPSLGAASFPAVNPKISLIADRAALKAALGPGRQASAAAPCLRRRCDLRVVYRDCRR